MSSKSSIIARFEAMNLEGSSSNPSHGNGITRTSSGTNIRQNAAHSVQKPSQPAHPPLPQRDSSRSLPDRPTSVVANNSNNNNIGAGRGQPNPPINNNSNQPTPQNRPLPSTGRGGPVASQPNLSQSSAPNNNSIASQVSASSTQQTSVAPSSVVTKNQNPPPKPPINNKPSVPLPPPRSSVNASIAPPPVKRSNTSEDTTLSNTSSASPVKPSLPIQFGNRTVSSSAPPNVAPPPPVPVSKPVQSPPVPVKPSTSLFKSDAQNVDTIPLSSFGGAAAPPPPTPEKKVGPKIVSASTRANQGTASPGSSNPSSPPSASHLPTENSEKNPFTNPSVNLGKTSSPTIVRRATAGVGEKQLVAPSAAALEGNPSFLDGRARRTTVQVSREVLTALANQDEGVSKSASFFQPKAETKSPVVSSLSSESVNKIQRAVAEDSANTGLNSKAASVLGLTPKTISPDPKKTKDDEKKEKKEKKEEEKREKEEEKKKSERKAAILAGASLSFKGSADVISQKKVLNEMSSSGIKKTRELSFKRSASSDGLIYTPTEDRKKGSGLIHSDSSQKVSFKTLKDSNKFLSSSSDSMPDSTRWYVNYTPEKKKYYVNEMGETAWDIPSNGEIVKVPEPWEQQWDESSGVFFYNKENGQVSWTLPGDHSASSSPSINSDRKNRQSFKNKQQLLPAEMKEDLLYLSNVGRFQCGEEIANTFRNSEGTQDLGDFLIGTFGEKKVVLLRSLDDHNNPEESVSLDNSVMLPKTYTVIFLFFLVSQNKEYLKELKRLKKETSSRFKYPSSLLIIPNYDGKKRDASELNAILNKIGAHEYIEINPNSKEDIQRIFTVASDISKERRSNNQRRFTIKTGLSIYGNKLMGTGSSSGDTVISGTPPSSSLSLGAPTLISEPKLVSDTGNSSSNDHHSLQSIISAIPKEEDDEGRKSKKGDELTKQLVGLFEDLCTGKLNIETKLLKTLLFKHSDKVLKKAQERAHKQAMEKSPFASKGLFHKSMKVSKLAYRFNVKGHQLNVAMFDYLTITNGWGTRATFNFVNHHEFNSEAFISFFPRTGTIEKGKFQDVKIGYVCFQPTKMETLIIVDVSIDEKDKDKSWTERFFIPVTLIGEEANAEETQPFWEIDNADIDTLKTLGSGASASVFLCELWGTQVAMKKWEFGRLDSAPADFNRELESLKKLRHPNVVSFIGAITIAPGRACLITEFLELGGLDTVLKNESYDLPFPLRVRMALDAANGMKFVHAQGSVHRDMKSLNLLVDTQFNVKVADFGESRAVTFTVMTVGIGTYLWMAPEVMNRQNYSFAADMFSMGVVLWELYTRKLPDRSMQDVGEGTMPPLPSDCPLEYAQLVAHCCNPTPSRRPNFTQLAEALSSYYKQLTESTIEQIIPEGESSEESSALESSGSEIHSNSSFEDSKPISPNSSFLVNNPSQHSNALKDRGRSNSSGTIPTIPPRTIHKSDSSSDVAKPSSKSFLSRIGSSHHK